MIKPNNICNEILGMRHAIIKGLIEREMQIREEHHYFSMSRTRLDQPLLRLLRSLGSPSKSPSGRKKKLNSFDNNQPLSNLSQDERRNLKNITKVKK